MHYKTHHHGHPAARALDAPAGAARRHRRDLRVAPSPATTAWSTRSSRYRAGPRPAPATAATSSTCAQRVERAAIRCVAELEHSHPRAASRDRAATPTTSTAASCSASCRWATPSSPSTSAPAARTRRSTPPAPAPPRPSRWPRTGSRPAAAAASSSSPPTTSPATPARVDRRRLPRQPAPPPPTTWSRRPRCPFDRRRHGMILGMGAAALVVESRGRGARARHRADREVLSTVTANSAFHGTRLDVEPHLRRDGEAGRRRRAPLRHRPPRRSRREMVFVSHETYTPARGGSAAAEVDALRARLRRPTPTQIVVANTKGFTGHAMGVGIEDVVAVKALETGIVPPSPTSRRSIPSSATSTCPRAAATRSRYALRLGAGFGSQISMTLHALGARRPTAHGPSARRAGLRVPGHRPGRWSALAARRQRPRRTRASRWSSARCASRDVGPAARPRLRRPAPAAPHRRQRRSRRRHAPPPRSQPLRPRSDRCRGPTPAGPTPAAPRVDPVEARCSRSSRHRPATRPTCSTSDLDLEADLGIDTVKQAETFAAIREDYDIDRDDNLALARLPHPRRTSSASSTTAPPASRRSTGSRAAAAAPAAATPHPRLRRRPPPGGRSGRRASAGDRRRANRLPARHARPRPGPRGRPRHRHRQAGRDVRRDPRGPTTSTATTTSRLRDYPTLDHVIGFVRDRATGLADAPAAAPAAAAPARGSPRARPDPSQPTAARRGRPGRRHGPRRRRRADRLPARHARPRPRPRGRPGHRHRQAGRDLRRDPRGLRHRPRRQPRAARLPHPRHTSSASSATRATGPRRPQPHPHRAAAAAPPPQRSAPAPASRPPRLRRPGRRRRSWPSSPNRPATRPTCSTSTSTSKPTWASTPSNRPRRSPRSARNTTSNATTTSHSATTRPSASVVGFVRDRATGLPSTRSTPAAAAPVSPSGGSDRPASAPRGRRPTRSPRRSWPSSPNRPATRRTCSTWSSTSKPTWASTP